MPAPDEMNNIPFPLGFFEQNKKAEKEWEDMGQKEIDDHKEIKESLELLHKKINRLLLHFDLAKDEILIV